MAVLAIFFAVIAVLTLWENRQMRATINFRLDSHAIRLDMHTRRLDIHSDQLLMAVDPYIFAQRKRGEISDEAWNRWLEMTRHLRPQGDVQ